MRRNARSSTTISPSSSSIRAEGAHATISATGPAGPWTIAAQASVGDAPALSLDARDLSLADLQVFDKKPPPLIAEGPIAIRLDAQVTPQSTLETLTGRFSIGAGRVRINNPDAVPFFIDEATGAVAWDEDARRFRVDKLEVLAGDARAGAGLGRAARRRRRGLDHPSRGARRAIRPGARGRQPGRARVRSSPTRAISRRRRGSSSTALPRADRQSTLALKAESAPDGDGSSLKLDLDASPSATPDLIRLWPQFINPDVRDWCAQNLHGGRLQGTMEANWTAADLDAMAHKRGLPRDSLHGEFTTRDVGVDLMPGLPIMMTDEGIGIVHRPRIHGLRQSRDHDAVADPARAGERPRLQHSRHHAAPDRRRVRARAHDRNRRRARRSAHRASRCASEVDLAIDPATVKGQAEGDLALDLKLGKTARPEDTQFHASGTLTNLQLDKFLGRRETGIRATRPFEADREMLKIAGDGHGPRRRDPYRGQPGGRRGRLGDGDLRARRRRARQARPQFRLVADRDAAGQAQGAA